MGNSAGSPWNIITMGCYGEIIILSMAIGMENAENMIKVDS